MSQETKINRIQGNQVLFFLKMWFFGEIMIANEWCAQAVTIEGVKKLVALTMDNIQAWDKFHLLVLF